MLVFDLSIQDFMPERTRNFAAQASRLLTAAGPPPGAATLLRAFL
jgi:hypothetical protein